MVSWSRKISSFLEDIRRERIREFGLDALIINFDGTSSSGKDMQIKLIKEYFHNRFKDSLVMDLRDSKMLSHGANFLRSKYLDDLYYSVIEKHEKEDFDKTLNIYIEQRKTIWENLVRYKQDRNGGVLNNLLLYNRGIYSTFALQLMLRRLNVESEESYRLIERLTPNPIIPPHLSFFTICREDIAYKRAERRAKENKQEDIFDKYYEVAYALLHDFKEPKGNKDERRKEKRIWWLRENNKIYEQVSQVVPQGLLVKTGKKSYKINGFIRDEILRLYSKHYGFRTGRIIT